MKIGIDIDDTISNTEKTYLKYAKRYDKKHVNGEGIINNSYVEYHKKFHWSKQQELDFYSLNLKNMIEKITVKKNAREVINKLKQEGHKIYLITSRSKSFYNDLEKVTKKWLDKNQIKFDKLIMNEKEIKNHNINYGDKGLVCKKEKIDIFIDDNKNHCNSVKKTNKNIKVILFDSNQNKDNSDFERAMNWKELYYLIKKFTK